jgi:hypothetical protein
MTVLLVAPSSRSQVRRALCWRISCLTSWSTSANVHRSTGMCIPVVTRLVTQLVVNVSLTGRQRGTDIGLTYPSELLELLALVLLGFLFRVVAAV